MLSFILGALFGFWVRYMWTWAREEIEAYRGRLSEGRRLEEWGKAIREHEREGE